MPSNATLPEDVRAVLRDTIEHLPNAFSETIIDAIAPLIIEWVRKDQAEKDARLIEPQSATMGAFLAGVIRDQFPTPDETTGDPDDHQ